MDFPTIIRDIIRNVRAKYGITLDNLKNLKPEDDYFPPLFTKDELSITDIHEPSAPPRIIAFGDIHGDLQALIGILYEAELIDVSGNWIEQRSTYVVQTGNLFCNYRTDVTSCLKYENEFDEFIILNYLTHLHRQAQQMKEKSRIVLCIGTHEFRNLNGDFSHELPIPNLDNLDRENLFKFGGTLAKKMSCIFRVIAKIGVFLFMHGGIHPGWDLYRSNFTSLTNIPEYNNWLNDKLYSFNEKPLTNTESWKEHHIYNNIYGNSNSVLKTKMIEHFPIEPGSDKQYIDYLNGLDTKNKLLIIVGSDITYDENNVPIISYHHDRIIFLNIWMSRAWTDIFKEDGLPCDLSNKQYNIAFIVIEYNQVVPKYKNVLNEKVNDIDMELIKSLLEKTGNLDKLKIIKKCYDIIKNNFLFNKTKYELLVLFTYEVDGKINYGLATINNSTVHKVYYIIDKTTKITFSTKDKKTDFENIQTKETLLHGKSGSSFSIIFDNIIDMYDFQNKLPPKENPKKGGRKIRSRNNRNRNRTTKYKKNKSIRNKNYYRISRRK